jgi:5-methylcytosine-specific restriction endonuclease McrA
MYRSNVSATGVAFCPRMDVLSSGAEGLIVRFRSIALLLCLLSSLNAFATPRHRHSHRSSFRSYSTRSTHHGRYRRSTTAKNNFKREHPCPSNGRSSGSCPGYVIDHIHPLECGGADAPFNMQWQTIADGKAKDKTERNCRL